MRVKNLLFGLLAIALCGGQMCLTPEPFERLKPNESLNEACASVIEGGQSLGVLIDLEDILLAVEAGRLAGGTKAELVGLIFADATCTLGCQECLLAIADQVYDYAPQ